MKAVPGPPGWEMVPTEFGEWSPQSMVAVKSPISSAGRPKCSVNDATARVNGTVSITDTFG